MLWGDYNDGGIKKSIIKSSGLYWILSWLKEHSLQVYDEYDSVILILCYDLKLYYTFFVYKILSMTSTIKRISFWGVGLMNVHKMNAV